MAVGGMAKAFDLKNRTSSQSSKASRKGSGKYKTTKNQEAKMICMLWSIQNTYEENRENLMFMIFCQEKKESSVWDCDFFVLQVAEIMNEHFINVKVDREERPDVDKVYMSFVQATTGGGGWPMSVFLTPKLKPIYGGTYFPPQDSVRTT